MVKIQARLDSLKPYLVGFRYVEGIQLVEVTLKKGWVIPESEVIKREALDGENNYMFYTDMGDIDLDVMLDYIQTIIDINIQREKKFQLLKDKVAELQVLFNDNTYDTLLKLNFTFGEPELVSMNDISSFKIDEVDMQITDQTNVTKVETVNIVTEPKINKVDTAIKGASTPTKSVNKPTVEKVLETNKFNDIELPPKGSKIELAEFEEPKNLTCKCGENDVCPICADEKGF
jgi:hypothetical protein